MALSLQKHGFLDLPLEIRDMIYAYAIHKRILVQGKRERLFTPWFVYNIVQIHSSQLGILRTSKAIREEASRLFFSKATFCFGPWLMLQKTLALTRHQMNLIKNVEFFPCLKGTALPSRMYPDGYAKLCASNIRRFGGPEIRRQTCEIHIEATPHNLCEIGQEPWLGAITSLVGFELVVLKIHIPECRYCRGLCAYFTHEDRTSRMEIEDYLRETFAALGPCVASNDGATRIFSFHPCKDTAGCA